MRTLSERNWKVLLFGLEVKEDLTLVGGLGTGKTGNGLIPPSELAELLLKPFVGKTVNITVVEV